MDTAEYASRLQKVIAQGCLTNSKHPSCFTNNYPHGILGGLGPYVEGFDKRQYFDTICGLGSVSVGYRNTEIDKQVIKQISSQGATFSLASPAEIEAAEFLLTEFLPQYDAVKWLKTGAEATAASVRIARAHTGRKAIIQVGYHGHHDQWISTKHNPIGLGDQFQMYETYDIPSTLKMMEGSEYAAIIVEPIMLDYGPENLAALRALKEMCMKTGAILIFDEIVCGMRIPECFISSVIEPDLVCVGKGIANGYSVSGVVGKKHLMHDIPYFVSSTFAGESHSLVAAKATMTYWRKNGFDELWEKSQETMKYINDRLNVFHVKLEGYGTRGYWQGPIEEIGRMFQEAIKCQILLGRSYFYNFASRQFDDTLRSRVDDLAMKLKRSDVTLDGPPPSEPFKRV